jgi:molybdopterin converting factor small subunit
MGWGFMVEDVVRIRVTLPSALREHTRGQDAVEVRAATLADVIARLAVDFPGLGYRILDDQGRLRRFVNAYVNDELVSQTEPQSVRLRDGDTVHILPSVAGG